ncbi:MAG: hypothetical protein QG670_2180 [Thermoproteota archaeon]|nr:hypothetical protein [Thermoproteota archaeon]
MVLTLPDFSSPAFLIIFIIQLVLGLGLGYFSIKIFKYLIALIGIFVVGLLLNVWQTPMLGTNLSGELVQLGLTWQQIYPIVMSIILTLGLTTVLPITLGFVIGIIVAMVK